MSVFQLSAARHADIAVKFLNFWHASSRQSESIPFLSRWGVSVWGVRYHYRFRLPGKGRDSARRCILLLIVLGLKADEVPFVGWSFFPKAEHTPDPGTGRWFATSRQISQKPLDASASLGQCIILSVSLILIMGMGCVFFPFSFKPYHTHASREWPDVTWHKRKCVDTYTTAGRRAGSANFLPSSIQMCKVIWFKGKNNWCGFSYKNGRPEDDVDRSN